MKSSQNRSKEKSQMISEQPKERMLPLLEKLVYIPKTVHIISIKISQHLLPTIFDPLKHFELFIA